MSDSNLNLVTTCCDFSSKVAIVYHFSLENRFAFLKLSHYNVVSG